MTWFRWLGTTLISSSHLPSSYLLPCSSKSLPSVSSKLSYRLLSSSNQQAFPFQARVIVFICTTVVARNRAVTKPLSIPLVVAPDRYSFVNKSYGPPLQEGIARSPSGESEPTGIRRQDGLLLYVCTRTEFITGLGLQFCSFDGFRWGESGLSPKALPSSKTNKTTKLKVPIGKALRVRKHQPNLCYQSLPAPIRPRDCPLRDWLSKLLSRRRAGTEAMGGIFG